MTAHKISMISMTAVFLLIQLLIMLGLAKQGRYDYMHSVIATTCFWGIYTIIEVKYGLYMNHYIRLVMIITLISDAFGGYYLNLYANSFIFDKCLHAFGTYSFSLFVYVLLAQLQNNSLKPSFKFILVVCLGLSMGALYEILEFFTDQISHPSPPSQPSLLDTDIDLISDVIGSILAAFHATYKNFIEQRFLIK